MAAVSPLFSFHSVRNQESHKSRVFLSCISKLAAAILLLLEALLQSRNCCRVLFFPLWASKRVAQVQSKTQPNSCLQNNNLHCDAHSSDQGIICGVQVVFTLECKKFWNNFSLQVGTTSPAPPFLYTLPHICYVSISPGRLLPCVLLVQKTNLSQGCWQCAMSQVHNAST